MKPDAELRHLNHGALLLLDIEEGTLMFPKWDKLVTAWCKKERARRQQTFAKGSRK